MKTKTNLNRKMTWSGLSLLLSVALLPIGCKRSSQGEGGARQSGGKTVIQDAGSDTLVNVAQAWAEEYANVEPNVSVEVSGGGSGTGIAALINGTVDIANCSRAMSDQEKARAKQNTGKEPKEFVLGYDALAVYVDKENPLNEATLEQLGEVFGEKPTIVKWSQLGIQNTKCPSDEIIPVGRQNSSGTYAYFREATLGEKRDYRPDIRAMSGSKDVVELIGKTPCAIGYSGMGYATPAVKMLKVAKKKGDPAYAPSVENTVNKTYPIARPLYMYTLGEPQGEVKKYIDWCHGPAGQKILASAGYVPVNKVEE